MKEIGAYFEIEYSNIEINGIHNTALKLNSGRYCLEYIVRAKKYTRIYTPYFICNVIFEPLRRNNVDVIPYYIDEHLEPVALPEQLADNEAFLYINYFGFKNEFIKNLSKKIKNLIIDNCQALHAHPLPDIDTFYALRKFAGVSDGAFLYCNATLDQEVPSFDNSDRIKHLYLRQNVNANSGHADFLQSETELANVPMSKMSLSSEKFLNTYDFAKNKLIRERNFMVLHNYLAAYNEYMAIDISNICGPLYYPLLVNDNTMRRKMIEYKIYISIMWPDLDASLPQDTYENYLSENLLPLPVDHRYNTEDMKRVADIFLSLNGKK